MHLLGSTSTLLLIMTLSEEVLASTITRKYAVGCKLTLYAMLTRPLEPGKGHQLIKVPARNTDTTKNMHTQCIVNTLLMMACSLVSVDSMVV